MSYDSFTLIINNSNRSGSNNNYVYSFSKGNFVVPKEAEIMLTSAQVPYSMFNITSLYGNNTFSISFPTGALSSTYTTFNITIPDGFYTVSSLNAYIQQTCIANGLYLIDNNNNYVYYLILTTNITSYANQILALTVPLTLPSGYTQPTNWIGYSTYSSVRTPYITIPNNNTFGVFLGFTAANYPPSLQTTSYSINSNQMPPVGSNVNSIIMRCSLINNSVTFPSDILDSFPITNVSFGSNISFSNNIEKWIKLTPGSYSSFSLTLVDQNLNNLVMNDPNILITLLISLKNKLKIFSVYNIYNYAL